MHSTRHIKGLGILASSIIFISLMSCNTSEPRGFTSAELSLINSADSIMRVYTTECEEDMTVLRGQSTDLPAEALLSEDFRRLTERMLATVTHPSQDGVGIAAPQVGLNRRIVAVQRFDKEPDQLGNYPFEIYANIRIVSSSDSLEAGPEGCLSVPGRSGKVMRSESVVIEYADLAALKAQDHADMTDNPDSAGKGEVPMIRETVSGFTAVIFQHETDHLEGILYIDRLIQQ